MSLNSKERCYFEGFEEDFQNLPELHWQTSKAYSVNLEVGNLSKDVFEAESYSTEKVIKVSDPIYISQNINLNSRYSIEGLRVYRDKYQSSIIALYRTDSINNLLVDSPAIYIGEESITQAHKILETQVTLSTFQGIYQGLYKGRIGNSYSPPIRSIANETVRSSRRVQVTIEDQEEFLFGFNYYPFPRVEVSEVNLTDPKAIAHGLYLLISKKEDQKIVGLLSQLSHYYIDLVGAKSTNQGYEATIDRIPGFPKDIFRWYRKTHGEVDVEQNVYLGLAIIDSISYLYNRSRSEIVSLEGLHNLEPKIKFVIDQISFLLSAVSDNGKSLPSAVLRVEGYASQNLSLTAGYIGSIFITHSLQLNYSLENHILACNLYDILKAFPWISPRNFQNIEATDNTSFTSDFAQILWILYFGTNNPDVDRHLGERLEFLENSDLSDFPQESVFFLGFYQALYPEMSYPNGDLLSERPFVNPPTKGENEDLYSVGSNEPYLSDQCYGGFIHSNYLFFRDIEPFPLLSEELNLFVSKLYREQVRVTPKGEQWFSQEAVNSSESVIGSLLLSSAKSFKTSILRYLIIKLAGDPANAIGFMGSRYSRIYLEKPMFQGDTYWNRHLDQYLNTDNSNNQSIQEVARNIADSTYVLEPPKAYHYHIEDEEGNIVERVFDPKDETDVSELVSNNGIVERVLDKDLKPSYLDLYMATSDEFLWEFMNQPMYLGEGTFGNPYLTVLPDQLLGYVTSKGASSTAVKIVKNLVPSGVYYKEATLPLLLKYNKDRSLESSLSIVEVG